jgi:hypothetical protein
VLSFPSPSLSEVFYERQVGVQLHCEILGTQISRIRAAQQMFPNISTFF